MVRSLLLCSVFLCSAPALRPQEEGGPAEDARWGHSNHGSAYDVGPRTRPWRMEGIGHTPFPITSSHPEVQQWFDQANALLHGFWWFEAERSLRWCLKLDPECAMAYWGMARAAAGNDDPKRARYFLDQALQRKDSVTPRERAFLELYEARQAMREAGGDRQARAEATREYMVRFDKLLMDHPDDIEAKALYWLDAVTGEGPGSGELSRYGMEAVFQDVLEQDPDHVGVLHYRIHNWDGKEGSYAIDSCMKLGDIAPECGHLLHMPGHVLSGIGLWHEAAIAMDRATRVEKAYMNQRMILPEQNWDYVHNLDYLGYIQEQLGMQETAILSAKQQLLAPGSPDRNQRSEYHRLPMLRVLVKFERWQDILDGDLLEWVDGNPVLELLRAYAEARAHLGLGDLKAAEARHKDLEQSLARLLKDGSGGQQDDDAADWFVRRMANEMKVLSKEVESLLTLARGDSLEGIRLLTEAAAEQEEAWWNDPPHHPQFLYNVLGEAYLELGSPRLATAAFDRTLRTVFRDGFALSGLVRAHAALGNVAEAQAALGTLKQVWSDADPNRWLEAALATGIQAEATPDPRLAERSYQAHVLDRLGPSLYQPSPAPVLTAQDADGRPTGLEAFAGQNVILIFYLGDECLHCMEQIAEASKRATDFRALDTVIVACSKDSVEEIREYRDSDAFDLTLLSDPSFQSARRFHSYDEFEDIELHSTILIDKAQRVHWARTGGDPFMDFDFLEREVRRLEEGVVGHIRSTAQAEGGDSR